MLFLHSLQFVFHFANQILVLIRSDRILILLDFILLVDVRVLFFQTNNAFLQLLNFSSEDISLDLGSLFKSGGLGLRRIDQDNLASIVFLSQLLKSFLML